MSGPPDFGRAAVYAAETAAFDGTSHELPRPLSELVAIADVLFGAAWWPHGPIAIRAARADAETSTASQRAGSKAHINIAASQTTIITLAHELGHVLANVSNGHGPLFRRAYVDVVTALLGTEPAAWLADQFIVFELPIARRTWHAPAPQGPIAL